MQVEAKILAAIQHMKNTFATYSIDVAEFFKQLDAKEQSGQLNFQGFCAILGRYSLSLSFVDKKKLFRCFDADRDNSINLMEFNHIIHSEKYHCTLTQEKISNRAN